MQKNTLKTRKYQTRWSQMNTKQIFGLIMASILAAFSGTAGTAAAAPDVTDRLQNLGIPLIERYPDRTYARNVWDMKYHDGKVFIGSGNSANSGPSPNAGPAQVWAIDPLTGISTHSYTIGGEQVDVFRVFSDGCLYVPDHDPPGNRQLQLLLQTRHVWELEQRWLAYRRSSCLRHGGI